MGKFKGFILIALSILPTAVYAYVGPGAGLSLIGALWALILATLTALFFIIVFPVRIMLRHRREAKQAAAESSDSENIVTLTSEDQEKSNADKDRNKL